MRYSQAVLRHVDRDRFGGPAAGQPCCQGLGAFHQPRPWTREPDPAVESDDPYALATILATNLANRAAEKASDRTGRLPRIIEIETARGYHNQVCAAGS